MNLRSIASRLKNKLSTESQAPKPEAGDAWDEFLSAVEPPRPKFSEWQCPECGKKINIRVGQPTAGSCSECMEAQERRLHRSRKIRRGAIAAAVLAGFAGLIILAFQHSSSSPPQNSAISAHSMDSTAGQDKHRLASQVSDPQRTPDTALRPSSHPLDADDSVHVNGYHRKDGTYVAPYTRRKPAVDDPQRTRDSALQPSSRSPNTNDTVHVKGYYRKDGTYVPPHTRRKSSR